MTAEEYRNAAKKKRSNRPTGRHLTELGRMSFVDECVSRGLPAPIPEYKPFMHLKRRHSVDFLFEHNGVRLALEVEGWGHKTDTRYKQDLWKYNELTQERIFLYRRAPKTLYLEETYDYIKRFFAL